ncbi:membrane protein [Spirochaetia bacterium]|nr:membrane protein [Spirochaetia bacterium]
MLGPIVNALVIVVCSLAGCFFIRGLPARFEGILKKAIGLSIIYVGIKGAMDNTRVLLLIMSLVLGAAIGELIDIDKWMQRLGDWAEKKLAPQKVPGAFSQGFVQASILFCSGSMAIVGSMQSGLQGDHTMLFAKSVLDGSISIVFAASLGIGVAFSAIPVLVYQGAIALAAMAAKNVLGAAVVLEMSSVGSLLVAAIGFNFLGVQPIKVANLIPAVFIPLIWMTLENFLHQLIGV